MSESSTQTQAATSTEASALAHALTSKMNRARAIKNKITSISMAVGGISVIIAIVLIFFYLAYVVFPLFLAPEMERTAEYPTPAVTDGKTLQLAIEEQNSIAVRFTDQAKAIFFNVKNGQIEERVDLELPQKSKITSFATSRIAKGFMGFGLNNGKIVFTQHKYRTTYIDDNKKVVPSIFYPLGNTPIEMDTKGKRALTHIGMMHDEEKATFVAYTDDNRLLLNQLVFDEEMEEDSEEISYESTQVEIPNIQYVNYILIDTSQSLLYVAHNNSEVF